MGKVHLAFLLIATAASMVACDENIEYPCGAEVTQECAKQFFGADGNCQILDFAVELPSLNIALPVFAPIAHASAILNNVKFTNLENGVVQSLYVNNQDNKLVISINFVNLVASDDNAIFIIDRVGREPKVVRESASATYTLSITAVIPTLSGLTASALKGADISAYLEAGNAVINLGPKLTQSTDPLIVSAVNKLGNSLDLVSQQILRTKATLIFLAWVENTICNFNLEPIQQIKGLSIITDLVSVVSDSLSNLLSPCTLSLNVKNCIRNYFASSGACTKVTKASGTEPVTRDIIYNYVPSANLTIIEPNSQVSGLNGKIESFRVNPVTGNVVLSLKFDGIVVETPESEVIIHRQGEEPVTITGSTKITYPVIITGVISMPITADSIANAYVSTFLTGTPSIEVGSTFTNSQEPAVTRALNFVMANTETAANELLVRAGQGYFLMALQNNICDFDLPYEFGPDI